MDLKRAYPWFTVLGLILLVGGLGLSLGGLMPMSLVGYDWVLPVLGVILILIGQQFVYRLKQREKQDTGGKG